MPHSSLLSPAGHVRNIAELCRLLARHRQLIFEMARREIGERYAGQMLGAFWVVGHPLIQMAIYVFVFALVFKAKVGGTRPLPMDYTTYLLCGLIPWIAVQEAMNKGVTAITSNANMVKQVVFPLEVLPVKGVITSFLTQLIATAALILYTLLQAGGLYPTYALLPVLIVLQAMAMIGLSLILSVVSVYLRDMKDIIQVFCLVNMYLMPVFYMPDMVPEIFRPIVYLNPFSYFIWCYQDVFFFGAIEHPVSWLIFALQAALAFSIGFRVFSRLKVYLGNLL